MGGSGLAGLRKAGDIRPAPITIDRRDPDVIFDSASVTQPLLVEITALSDAGYHDKNPVSYFIDEVARHLSKRGLLTRGGLDFRIGDRDDDGIILGVPLKKDVAEFLQSGTFHASDLKDTLAQAERER